MIRLPWKTNYAARIAGALSTFASIKEDLMEANTDIKDKVSQNNSEVDRLVSKNEALETAKTSNENIITSLGDMIKKGM